jgi:hypothetical protein
MRAMNINNLEKLSRQALKGENVGEKSGNMLRTGLISPVEHRSLQSLSFQIAANLHAGKDASTVAIIRPNLTWV